MRPGRTGKKSLQAFQILGCVSLAGGWWRFTALNC